MKVLLSWLREFVPIDIDTAALCEKLSLGGLAVDAVEELGAEIRGVIVGELLSTAPHPQADRLTLCEVRTGPEPAVRVVCGARNMTAGDRVAYASPGTILPGGKRIEAATIRGVASAGMLCSAAELGLAEAAEAAEGILILDGEAPLGARVGAYLGLEDTRLDIDVTPNRGDCLSIVGIAREVAALPGAKLLRTRSPLREQGVPAAAAIALRIDDAAGCPRYAARLVRGVRVGPSPAWLVRRLEGVGLRAINNVVDVTNLVMIERGQPLHAFDYDRLARPEIAVRRAGATALLRTPRRRRAAVGAGRPADHHRRRADRAGWRHGRRRQRGAGGDDDGAARVGLFRPVEHPPHGAPHRAALGGVVSLRARRRHRRRPDRT